MDVASHWLMGSGATSGRTKFWVAGLMGVLPDLLVFIPNSFFLDERPEVNADTVTADFGWYAWEAYQVTHSLIWATIGFLFTWILFEKRGVTERLFTDNTLSARNAAIWLWLPWFIHIFNDIPTHTAKFFPTPFLAPFSDFQVDGYRWSTPWVWFTNLAIIIAIWSYVFYKRRNQSLIEEGA